MANTIIVKRSSVAGKVPAAGDLQVGELAVNLTDKKIYSKDSGGTVIQLGGGSGTGDVVGPSSATDNALARYDGTTGKLIQNSIVSLDDNGNLQNLNGIAFDTTPTSAPTAVGAMYWDNGNGTPSVILDTDVELQLGQESLAKVYNGTGSTITKGSVVAVSGAQGQRPSVVLADADSEPLSAGTLGIAAEDIANGAEGFVCTFGLVRGLNTSAFTAGAPIYLSQTAGAFTATRPSAPAHTVFLGWVISVNASSGELFVNISNGWELDELHNVLISSPVSGNTLVYDATAGVWKNASLTAGTAISVTNGAGSITIANTGVTSLAGTANQITASASTGAVTLSLPATINVNTSGSAATLTTARTIQTNLASTTAASFNGSANITPGVTGTLPLGNGGTGSTTAAGARTSLGATTVGSNLFTLTNPSAITFPRFNADNTVSALSAVNFRTAIGAGTGDGTVTSVGITAGTGISVSGSPITSSGSMTVTNTGVTSIVAGSGISISGATGAVTISASGSTGQSLNFDDFTAAAGQTTFSPSATYTSGKIQVFKNGVLLRNGSDVTVTSGTAVVFATACDSGDLITLVYPPAASSGSMRYDQFTATASQTTFVTSATYTSGKIQVFVEGVLQRNNVDVTVTSGTQIVFATGLDAGDLVDVTYPV